MQPIHCLRSILVSAACSAKIKTSLPAPPARIRLVIPSALNKHAIYTRRATDDCPMIVGMDLFVGDAVLVQRRSQPTSITTISVPSHDACQVTLVSSINCDTTNPAALEIIVGEEHVSPDISSQGGTGERKIWDCAAAENWARVKKCELINPNAEICQIIGDS